MNNLDKLLNEAKEELMNDETVQNYFYYKNLIENDEKLKNLDEEIRKHQRLMCQYRKDNDSKFEEEKRIYEELKNEFDTNPILINFQNTKEEIYSLLSDIKEVLEAK